MSIAFAAGLLALGVAMWGPLSGAAPPRGHSISVPAGAQVKVTGTSALMTSNGETGTFTCYCKGGKGACSLSRGTSSMVCDSSGGAGACTGECVFETTTTGVARGAAARANGASNMSRAP